MTKYNTQPKVTVIVPIYNTEKYLAKCLDSIVNQTLKDIEIILVTDGPEACDKICDDYAKNDKRITVIKNVKKGPGGARNAGIDIAKADYIMFVDSDDTIEPNMCEVMYRLITTEDVDMVHCGTNVEYEIEVSEEVKNNDNRYFLLKENDRVLVSNKLFKGLDTGPCNKIYKKSLLDKYVIRFPENMYFEDNYFLLSYMATCTAIYYNAEKLYKYLRRVTSTMGQTHSKQISSKVLDNLTVGKMLYEFLQKNRLFEKFKTGFYMFYSELIRACLIYFAPNGYEKEAFDIAHNFLKDKDISDLKGNEFAYLKKVKNCTSYEHFLKMTRNLKSTYIKIFGIPVFKIQFRNRFVTSYYLFNIILLYRTVRKHGRNSIRLLNFIPLFSIKTRNW